MPREFPLERDAFPLGTRYEFANDGETTGSSAEIFCETRHHANVVDTAVILRLCPALLSANH